MNKTLFFFLLLMFIPLISAASTEFYKQGDTVDLRQTCHTNGSYCSAATTCNITVRMISPNSTLILSNQQMTNNEAYHNFTLNSSQTDILGDYEYIVTCKDGGESGFNTFYFKINPTGIEPTDQRSSTLIFGIVIIFALAIVLFISGFLIKKMPIRMTFFILGALAFLSVVNLTFLNLQDAVVNPSIVSLFDFITAATWYFYWLGFGLIGIIWVLTVISTATQAKQEKNIRKYYSDD